MPAVLEHLLAYGVFLLSIAVHVQSPLSGWKRLFNGADESFHILLEGEVSLF